MFRKRDILYLIAKSVDGVDETGCIHLRRRLLVHDERPPRLSRIDNARGIPLSSDFVIGNNSRNPIINRKRRVDTQLVR